MAVEIERKFLVVANDWPRDESARVIRQGYLCRNGGVAARVRRYGDDAFICVKWRLDGGVVRQEFEYPIPVADAEKMLVGACLPVIIDKIRHRVTVNGVLWEIDQYRGANAPLVVAEVELAGADQDVTVPPWVGPEVSTDRRYFNAALSEQPYGAWAAADRLY